ncbi:MAG: Single-stranded nucleic acid binding R3H domain protein [Parcubacteria group bacterium GW2011_GWC1_43_12]|nr:MAG: Single-stranded nucleic acid binding R3H domain protein [Parcubacteria group bacterium GW2011_GWB1_42_6]KKS91742.1 MAG: Single-stranded nucleic acid binding R3H domain protein [Parcubacteria group bacterium GW2011_GWC1_43_12]
MKKNLSLVKKAIEELIGKMDFSGNVEVSAREEGYIVAEISTSEASFLIGRSGETLDALQHLARNIINKGKEDPVKFIVDINGYRKSRLDMLVSMAKNLAREALENKEAKWLPAMNPFERRAVHMALSQTEGIKTESSGEGEERKIVIKPEA